jgi:hypothetical protein
MEGQLDEQKGLAMAEHASAAAVTDRAGEFRMRWLYFEVQSANSGIEGTPDVEVVHSVSCVATICKQLWAERGG